MPAPIGGRLQPSREAVESLLRSRKGTLKAVGSTKESRVQLKEPRLQGYVAKRGEWKTIDQRERSTAKARKTQRRGIGAAVLGGGAAVGTYAAGHDKGNATFLGGNKTWQEAGELTRGAKQVAKVPGVGLGTKAKYLGRAAMARPMGATFIGGLGLAGAGGVGYAQGKVREGYHQSRINARRKANFSRSVGKRAPMDHEPSGFARYGDGSSKGKRLPDEFSKSEPVSKRVRNKDAESDRQRRLGMGVAATGVGSALLLRRGVGGALKTTRNLRGLGLQEKKMAWNTTPSEVKQLITHYKGDKQVRGNGVAMTRRNALETAGGTALAGSALGLEHYSRSQRNRRWE